MERPFDRHIDNEELNALVPSPSETGEPTHGLSADAIRSAERHTRLCADCDRKVSEYRRLVERVSSIVVSKAALPGTDCPRDEDVDWHEVAAGLWPELKASQLIMHAALCDYCGPRLRAAISADAVPTPQEHKLLAALEPPLRPGTAPVTPAPSRRLFISWLVPVLALLVIVGVLSTWRHPSRAALSGPEFAEFAVDTYRQFGQGTLALDVHSNSQQTLNEWLKLRSQFALALPASPAAPGEERPYRLEGARIVRVGSRTADYIAYQMQAGPVALMVTPYAVAVASGGVVADFRKVSFHYSMVDGYKVVTWSQHGLTYALVSHEGTGTQGSCMVCHSAMRDRDVSQTPTPLLEQ